MLLPNCAYAFSLDWFFSSKVTYTAEVETAKYPNDASTSTIRAILKEEFSDAPIMVEIARCESRFRQLDKTGEVLRGEQNSKDVGVFQVNEFYHLEDSEKMGLDIHSLEGNIQYARHLYDTQGTRPWNWSKKCWAV